jgi:hypothetical protein
LRHSSNSSRRPSIKFQSNDRPDAHPTPSGPPYSPTVSNLTFGKTYNQPASAGFLLSSKILVVWLLTIISSCTSIHSSQQNTAARSYNNLIGNIRDTQQWTISSRSPSAVELIDGYRSARTGAQWTNRGHAAVCRFWECRDDSQQIRKMKYQQGMRLHPDCAGRCNRQDLGNRVHTEDCWPMMILGIDHKREVSSLHVWVSSKRRRCAVSDTWQIPKNAIRLSGRKAVWLVRTQPPTSTKDKS